MPPQASSPGAGSLPAGRTTHACAQCRHRKQKCGGFTYGIKCRPCTTRKVKCSFQEEVMDLRHNPYLRMRSSKSPTASAESTSAENNFCLSPASAALIPALMVLDRGDGQAPLPGPEGAEPSPSDEELPRQVRSLSSRISDLERRLVASQRDHHPSPPIISPASFPNSDTYSFSSSPGAAITDGPLKTLNRLQTDDSVELEVHDPISRPVLTPGEAYVIFKLFFSHGHPNAPFLDVDIDSDPDRVRSNSTLLFLAILSVGARFWSASSKTSCWLHPRYTQIVRLLDAEIMRVTLRPRQEDHKLETVQALMLCAHWMPLDISSDGKRYRSRFSEAGAWHCLGLAIRWATSLALERSCHLSFQRPDAVTRTDAQRFRTMLYLTESDHYLALSARRPSYLNPEPLNSVIENFLRCPYVQPTDMRLACLFQVAYGAHFTGCRPITIESVEAFDRDVQLVERRFTSNQGGQSMDAMSQHFPFTSLRWYQLSYTCAFLDNTDQNRRTGQALMWAIEWASQILIHLSTSSSQEGADHAPNPPQLEPDPAVIDVMSFTIDHYFVVIAYAAFFLVNSWLRNFVDLNLRPHAQQPGDLPSQDPSSSLLFRLVDVAARTLEAASPPEGHLARRYVPLLRGMADIILSDNTQPQPMNVETSAATTDATNLQEQFPSHLGEDLWDMLQQAGLEPINWPNLMDDTHAG
ncbi:hypothetical protein BGZ63DRAFT_61585 [Mariannaea sp. PMI_226]|nr:hypothetical protein BGZ63DRAFT_61585 [Mariannaea sp. PMI_226]